MYILSLMDKTCKSLRVLNHLI